MGIGIDIHGWRGFGAERDLFFVFVRVGFVTLFASRELVSDLFAEGAKQVRE
jgi:hypothetical protein